jgi:hypothetical protein
VIFSTEQWNCTADVDGKKGRTLDTQEKFHIYEISKHGLELNDNFVETTNPIYDVILDLYRT